ELQTFAVEQAEVTGRFVGVRQQPGFVQHVDRKLLRIRAGQAGAVERGSQDVLIHAQLREWPRNLKCAHDAEPRAPVRGDAADIAPLEPDDTVIGRDDAGEHVEQRTFAGAVWSDQSDAGGAIDRAADVVGHDDGAIPLVQMIDFEQCGHRSSRPALRFKWKGAFRPRLGGSLAGTQSSRDESRAQLSCDNSLNSASGFAFDVPALTISSSYLYLPDLALRHCPPVSGCTATLLIGDLPK